jgi:hypothetical protein
MIHCQEKQNLGGNPFNEQEKRGEYYNTWTI